MNEFRSDRLFSTRTAAESVFDQVGTKSDGDLNFWRETSVFKLSGPVSRELLGLERCGLRHSIPRGPITPDTLLSKFSHVPIANF